MLKTKTYFSDWTLD